MLYKLPCYNHFNADGNDNLIKIQTESSVFESQSLQFTKVLMLIIAQNSKVKAQMLISFIVYINSNLKSSNIS